MTIMRMVITLIANNSTVDESGCIICNVLVIHGLQFRCYVHVSGFPVRMKASSATQTKRFTKQGDCCLRGGDISLSGQRSREDVKAQSA